MSSDSPRSSYHHGDARNALLTAAGELLEQTGAAGLSLRRSRNAPACPGMAPYNHFADKAALLAELVADGFGRPARRHVGGGKGQDRPRGPAPARGAGLYRFRPVLARPVPADVRQRADRPRQSSAGPGRAWLGPGDRRGRRGQPGQSRSGRRPDPGGLGAGPRLRGALQRGRAGAAGASRGARHAVRPDHRRRRERAARGRALACRFSPAPGPPDRRRTCRPWRRRRSRSRRRARGVSENALPTWPRVVGDQVAGQDARGFVGRRQGLAHEGPDDVAAPTPRAAWASGASR